MAIILVIDDDVGIRRFLARALASEGHKVLEAPDGLAGLTLFRERAPELVITDIVMPGKEGIETIREMRRHTPRIKILAISGSSFPHSAHYLDMAAKLGADVTLLKPIRPAELRDAVATLIGAGPQPS